MRWGLAICLLVTFIFLAGCGEDDPFVNYCEEVKDQQKPLTEALAGTGPTALIDALPAFRELRALVDKVRAATLKVMESRPDLLVDGPIQYDAASVESVGKQKAPGSPVAGHANVFVFPDLNTGNTTYKAVQRSANVVSVGPMLQGLRKPVNDLSRGALVDDIVFTIALTAIQAQMPVGA